MPRLVVRHRRRAARHLRAGRAPRRGNARRAARDREHDRAARGARRCRLRDQHDPGRRLRAVHRDRLRDPQAVRPAPDDRRHARHRRHHARRCAPSRCCSRCARTWSELCPDVLVPQLRQPDGDELLGDRAREPDPHGRPVPQRAGHRGRARAGPRRADRGDRLPGRRHQPHGVLPAASSADGEDLYPRLQQLAAEGRVAELEPGALRDAAAGSATSSPSRASTSPSTCRGSSSATGPI